MVDLLKASSKDCNKLLEIQAMAFTYLLDKYNDVEMNPANESVDKINDRIKQAQTAYYFIINDNEIVGALRVDRIKKNECKILTFSIIPKYQGNGYGQDTLRYIENLYPHPMKWTLETIKEESKLCYLYEKMGYKRTGQEKVIKKGMTFVSYEKEV